MHPASRSHLPAYLGSHPVSGRNHRDCGGRRPVWCSLHRASRSHLPFGRISQRQIVCESPAFDWVLPEFSSSPRRTIRLGKYRAKAATWKKLGEAFKKGQRDLIRPQKGNFAFFFHHPKKSHYFTIRRSDNEIRRKKSRRTAAWLRKR